MIGIKYFGIFDYLVVGGTLLISLLIGLKCAIFSQQTNEMLLVGERKMGTLSVSVSIMFTYLSAITILDYPAEVYSFGVEIFVMTIVAAVFIPLSAFVFVPVFYDLKLTSVYEYLEQRFQSVLVRWFASLIFILQQLSLNVVALYSLALAFEAYLGLPILVSVLTIGFCGTVYTSIGGFRAVILTDIFQFLLVHIGLIGIVVYGFILAGGISQTFDAVENNDRLNLFDFTFDPFMRHSFYNILLGQGLFVFLNTGTHQLQVQKYSSLPTREDAIKAIVFSVPLKLIFMTLCLFAGIVLFATHAGCDPILLGKIDTADKILPLFVIEHLSFIPGMMGFLTSCLLCAVLSFFSSSLNSLVAVTWQDFLSKALFFSRMKPVSQTNVSRLIGFLYGIISVGLALAAEHFGTVYTSTLSIIGITQSAVGGLFILALFMPCVNKFGAVTGLIAGLSVMIVFNVEANIIGKSTVPLPTNVESCPAGTNVSSIVYPHPAVVEVEPTIEWPEKLFTVSYILYPVIGAGVTIAVGLLASILTGGCCKCPGRKVNRKYLHPLLYKSSCCAAPEENLKSQSHLRVDRLASVHNLNTQSNAKLDTIPPPYSYCNDDGYSPVPTTEDTDQP